MRVEEGRIHKIDQEAPESTLRRHGGGVLWMERRGWIADGERTGLTYSSEAGTAGMAGMMNTWLS